MTGPRFDYRSRSASPPSRPTTGNHAQGVRNTNFEQVYEDSRPLPPFVTIWGIPEYNKRTQRVEWRASVIADEAPAEMKIRQIQQDTGSEPTFIERIDLGRRVPEKAVSFSSFLKTCGWSTEHDFSRFPRVPSFPPSPLLPSQSLLPPTPNSISDPPLSG